jgi:phosphoenolpyruvate synthase/pyruvate phosphate dikinase
MSTLQLQSEIEKLPDYLKKEVEDFIGFLLEKEKKKQELITKKGRTPGLAKGMITMSPDFDEPLDDFKEYM